MSGFRQAAIMDTMPGWAGGLVLARETAVAGPAATAGADVLDFEVARRAIARRPGPAAPVWVLSTHRVGDASQTLALAEALGLPFEVKSFVRRKLDVLAATPWSASLGGIDIEASSPLTAPWPALVLSAGRENEPIARWIKRASGGRTRLVHVGRPWGNIDAYDLVVTTPQYRLPRRENVLENEAPLHRVTDDRLEVEALRWLPRLAHLPRPFVTVLVGGNSGPYALDREAGERLGREASDLARRLGGSLLISTSKRTPSSALAGLASAIDVPHYLFGWKRGAAENPYFAFLGLADQVVVTGDSMSMIAEACATGRPTHLFDLGAGVTSMRAPLGLRGEYGKPPLQPGRWLGEFGVRTAFYRALLRFAPSRVTRDIRLVHRRVVAAGRARWLGEEAALRRPSALTDMDRAVARVWALIDGRPAKLGRAA